MEKRICVTIPTDDGVYVKLGHFGDGKYYYHYMYENGSWKLVRKVENPYAGQHAFEEEEDEEASKRPKIYEMNKECTHIVAVAFGPGGAEFMQKRGLRVIRVKPRTTIDQALKIVEEHLKNSKS
jgi:predicted Fe-Mo cluster-binding NifX family protein